MQTLFRFLLCTCLALLASVCGAQVVNQANVSFAGPAGAGAPQNSNIVSAVGTQRNTITYFTGFDYTRRAAVTAAGQILYMQAVAPACNANPNAIDSIRIDVRASSSGDTETFTAVETSPDSGVFRVPRNAMPVVTTASASTSATANARFGASDADDSDTPKTAAGDGALAAAKNDTLTASIEGCGSGVSTASILVDPSGVVFDSRTNAPLAGASVTLIDVTGAGNGGHAGGPARVFAIDGVTPAPSTLVTGASGGYVFPLVAPSLYRLHVIAPTNYTYPSKVPAAQLPAGRTIHLYGSYGANFPVNDATGAVTLDVPLDPVPGALYLEKSASRASAELGDFVDYTIRVHNAAEQDLQGVIVDDDLPAGFHYQGGTLRLDDAALADPAPGNDSKLQVAVGRVASGGVVTLRYRVRIGAGALQGDGINRARATSAAPLVLASSVAAAKVKVEAGVFSEKGFIVGRVFADCDADGLKNAQEPGVPGVRIYLEDGSWSVTDAEGRYSFAQVRPRTHVAKLDSFTLPAGSALAITSGRNAGDAGSHFVDLKDGELAKADFAVAAAKVKVTPGVFSEKGYIVGNVFADCDGDGLRGADEPGVPGVRVYLEDGSYAQTDSDGRYGFAELRPRTHVAKIDGSTLPRGAVLAVLSNRNSGDAGSRFVDLHDGELAKADFAVAACNAELRQAIAARRSAALAQERPVVKAIPAQAAAAAGAKAAADNLETMDNSLGFIGLADGAVLPHATVTVRVKGGAASTFTLSVNGEAVSEQRVGKRSTVATRQLESWEFVGIALKPGKNVLEVAQRDQFGNPRGSRRIEVSAPGKLAQVRLELDKNSVAADGKSLALLRVRLEDANGVAVAERTAVTLDTTRGEWQTTDLDPRTPGLQLFIEGGVTEVALRAPLAAGEANIKAGTGKLEAEARVEFVPDLRPMVAAGVVDGTLSLNHFSGNTSNPNRGFDGFEDALRHFSKTNGRTDAELGARAAMFAKGKVDKDTLLTLSYDSDKAYEQPLFRDLDPTAYYPTYGDSAQRGFDAQSTSRLYLRADRNKSWLLFGDYTPPGVTPARNLGAYNRSLNGLRHHYEENGVSIDSFLSRDHTRQMVEEIAANGTSGPYLTGSGVMVINSERIELIVRDRNRPGVLVSSTPQVRYTDYDIEPLTGRILFRAPVPSLDADLNPITIRISYEIDQGSPDFWIGGVAGQVQLTKNIEVGASYVDDRNPVATTQLTSVNGTIRPDAKTVVTVEAARMEKMGAEGRAARIDATRKDGKLETHLYAGRADLNFDNPAASLPKGRVEDGLRATYRLNERVSFGAEALHTGDLSTGAARDGAQLSAGYVFGSGIRAEVGVRRSHETAADNAVVTQPDLTSLRMKLAAQVPGLPQAGVSIEAEQDVRDSARRMVALGGDYRLAGGSRFYGRHELISSLGSNYDLNEGQQRNATVFGIDSDYMKDGRLFSEYRARADALDSGRQAEAAIGLRNLWTVADGVRVNTNLERVKVLSGSAANQSVAVAGAVEYTRNPAFKGTARLELRYAEDSDSMLNTLGLAYRLSDTWSLLGKNTLAITHSKAGDSSRVNELLQSGVAYRALASLGWNGLAKYEYKRESDSGAADLKRQVHSVSVTANWQPRAETVFSGRYAAKLAQDRSGGLDTRSTAQLLAGRVTQELGRDWDVGATAQMLVEGGTRSRQFGLGLEAGYQLRKNTWVSVGYNLLGFREPDLAAADATARGAYVRLRMKFDERTLEGLLPAQASN